MRADVTLRQLDETLLRGLLDAAVADADPDEVMPPVAGPDGWTDERQAAFLSFHQSRSLATEPIEATYAILVGPPWWVPPGCVRSVTRRPRPKQACGSGVPSAEVVWAARFLSTC